MPQAAIQKFADWLTERCEFLRNLEQEAQRTLQEDNDTDKYKAMMCQKAMFLQALPEEAEAHMEGVPDDIADMAAERLDRFSRSASQALSIDSVFFMFALLYPEDHKPGQPNALEVLTAEIAELAKK